MVFDISNTGLSVLETSDNGTLIPGMIISDLMINYAGTIELNCNAAQVLYRKAHGNGKVRCGIAILDMSIKAYTDLTNIIACTFDPNTHVSDRIDLEALWNFFLQDIIHICPKKCIGSDCLKNICSCLFILLQEQVHFTHGFDIQFTVNIGRKHCLMVIVFQIIPSPVLI